MKLPYFEPRAAAPLLIKPTVNTDAASASKQPTAKEL
jgi:hypothetical protein